MGFKIKSSTKDIFLRKEQIFWREVLLSGDKCTTGAPGPMSKSYKGH